MAESRSDMKSLLSVALSIKNIRKTEMILPIARKSAVVTTFLLGDHTSLKTALLSPQNYDREMTKCLHRHTQFIEPTGNDDNSGKEIELTYDQMTSNISNIDKICLIWAAYKSTYKDLGLREISCPGCKTKNKYLITLDELIQEDTITIWEDEETSFYDYVYPIVIEYGDEYEYVFDTCIPSIQRYNQLLGLISYEKIQENLETNAVLSSSEQLAVVVKKIYIKKNNEIISSSSLLVDILAVLESAIPLDISDKVNKKYEEKFNKYRPNFYTNLKCTSCGTINKYSVDIETEFFRRALFGGESG